MNRILCSKVFFLLVLMLVVCSLTGVPALAGPRSAPKPADVGEIELTPVDIDELESGLEDDGGISVIEACKNVTLTPASITATKPFRLKVYQIVIDVTIGDCGIVICSTMGFDITWNTGPASGATLLGPFPSEPVGQVCVGNSTSSKAFLILKKDIPNGNYSLKIKVGGFGSAEYWNLPVTVTGG